MILQNMIIPDVLDVDYQVYYRAAEQVLSDKNGIRIRPNCTFRTDTYMNAFDIGTWKKYDDLEKLYLRLKISGRGKIIVYQALSDELVSILHELSFYTEKHIPAEYCIPLEEIREGILYFEIQTQEETYVEYARFETDKTPIKDIKLAIVICTYKRRKQLEALLTEIDCEADEKWLSLKVVDNASELNVQNKKNMKIYHNPNTGGSGGFSRGMDEVITDMEEFPATHVVLMDDDVTLQKESLYRLRALLSYMKCKYCGESIAGRMFRLDKPWIQYTAAEIWNAGDIRHIGWNQDMTKQDCLWNMNENEGGEYGGWWFACYPIEFVKENRPMPFFLHCDDVEYGLRHGGEPIILNGIQVWHETYEYRQSPVMLYYDTRNTLFVNEKYGLLPDKEKILEEWKRKISEQHVKGAYLKEYMVIAGLRDYLRGECWLYRKSYVQAKKIMTKKKSKKITNALFGRYTKIKYEMAK